MKTNDLGMALIRRFEGFEAESYFDTRAGKWTIGYGTTREVQPGETVSQPVAEAWLRRDVADTEALLIGCLPGVTLTSNEFSALVSFCYNVGMGRWGNKSGFRELKDGGTSTMRKLLLAGDKEGAAGEFTKWIKAGGIPMAGLMRRRLAEQALFRQPDYIATGA